MSIKESFNILFCVLNLLLIFYGIRNVYSINEEIKNKIIKIVFLTCGIIVEFVMFFCLVKTFK